MAMCFGIKIILQDINNPVVENTDVGLYNSAGNNSEFRWIQTSQSNFPTWKNGIIIENGIKPFSVEINLTGGGNISFPGSGSVVIKNNNKFHEILESLGIVLSGLKLEVWYFINESTYSKKLRTYICQDPEYNNREYSIPFKGPQETRVANILNIVTSHQYPYASNDIIGRTIPATFGRLSPKVSPVTNRIDRSSVAKFVRTLDTVEDKKLNDDFLTGSGYVKTISFPLKEIIIPGSVYEVELRGITGLAPDFFQDNCYVKITDGTGSGQMRSITGVFVLGGTPTTARFTISDFFETELSVSDVDNARSWCQFIIVNRRYDCDHWPCDGFFDSSGNRLTTGAELYVHNDDDGMSRMAPYGYEFSTVGTGNNKIAIDPKLFTGDIDSQSSVLIVPVENLQALSDATLDGWIENGSYYTKHSTYDGVYNAAAGDQPITISSYTLEDLDKATDKDSTTYANFDLDCTAITGTYYFKALKFTLPDLPKNFSFDSCKLAVKILDNHGADISIIRCSLRKFKYVKKVNEIISYIGNNDVEIDNIPDFYYDNEPNTKNENYFVNLSSTWTVTGHGNTVFDTEITTRDEYESYVDGAIIIRHDKYFPPWTDITKIYEFGIMFEKASDIKNDIYSTFHGRVFSQPTWRAGYDPYDVIEKPVFLLEHLCRLQDYRDTCQTPVSGWGLQYAGSPLIADGDQFGAFDDQGTLDARNYYLAGQVYDYDDGFTDKLKQKVCSEFNLANWQDGDGYEKVIPLPWNKLAPVYTVTLDDILDRSSVKVKEFPKNKIYSEPFVNYDYNPGSGKYDNILKVTNTSASIYNSAYASGFNNETDRQEIWNSCHSLALMCHRLNKMPSDYTDLKFANGAGSYTVAFNYLKHFIKWQFCDEIEFKTHFNIAASWQECTPINVLFSHHTNNVSRSALVEESVINPNGPYDVMIRAIMYA